MLMGLCKRNGVMLQLSVSSFSSENRTVVYFNLSVFLNRALKKQVPQVCRNQ